MLNFTKYNVYRIATYISTWYNYETSTKYIEIACTRNTNNINYIGCIINDIKLSCNIKEGEIVQIKLMQC